MGSTGYVGRGKGKLQLVICCRAKAKTGGLDLDGRSEGL